MDRSNKVAEHRPAAEKIASRQIDGPPRSADLMAMAVLCDDLAHELKSASLGQIALTLAAAVGWRDKAFAEHRPAVSDEVRQAAERGRKLYREAPAHMKSREQCLI